MTRKLVALLLVVSMVFCMFAGCANKQELVTTSTVEVNGYNITIKESMAKRESSSTLDGVTVKCEYVFEQQEYWLYINEEPLKLGVTIVDDGLEVSLANEIDIGDIENSVVAQMALVASISSPLFIDLSKNLVAIAVLGYVTSKISVSLDTIGGIISGVRTNSKTYYHYRTIDIAAADAIRFGKIDRSIDAYYEAYLKGNTVFISKSISQYQAVWRLKNGYDVFAISDYAALSATYKAAVWPENGGIIKHTYSSEQYPHYHPVGRKWINNPSSYPHCWYPQ